MRLSTYLKNQGSVIDQALRQVLQQSEGVPRTLTRAMRYSLLSDGKRIRPILALASTEALRAPAKRVLPFACALEMIHAYSLIHDDLPAMDDDDLRRGKPTNHKVFGEGMAILAGDSLLTEAFHVMTKAAGQRGQDATAVIHAIREVACAAGAAGMVGGQVADLESEHKKPTRTRVEYIHTRKTAALLRASVRVGAYIGRANTKQFACLDGYGTAIGLAFQVADDILDIEGGTEKTGKTAGRDAQLEKVTYPAAIGLNKSKQVARELLDEACEAIAPLGRPAEPLHQIACFIVERAV